MQPASRASIGGLPRGGRPELRAAAKLISAPAPVPDLHALTGRAEKRKHLLAQLEAQDELYAIVENSRELLQPAPTLEDQSPATAGVLGTLRSRLQKWNADGEAAATASSTAHEATVEDLLSGASAFAADCARLRKAAKREDCDEAVRARDEATTDMVLLHATAATTRRMPPDTVVPLPAAGLLKL